MGFASDVRKFCEEEAPEYIDTVIRRTVIEAGRRVIMRSPVGDGKYWKRPPPPGYVGGRFRGNWQYGFNASPSGELDAVDMSGAGTLSSLVRAALSSPGTGVHYITNNLPYAERIENGWSRQAPQGVVGLTEIELPQIFREAQR